MLAAAHVNVHYLLILLLPSVVACIVLALTWRSRIKRRHEADAEQRRRAATPRGSAKSRRGSAAKPRDGSAAKRPRR
jgi:flagellar biosynthesis/type III secretory pathway M-ring protein FliF/YscJ